MTERFYDSAENKSHLVLINTLVSKGNKLLISKRSLEEPHEPGSWTIPGGKVEKTSGNIWNIIEKTMHDEVLEETGVELEDVSPVFITNNTYIRSTGQHVIALVFLSKWRNGNPVPLEDTTDVAWITRSEIGNYLFAPNVVKYLEMGFDAIDKNNA